MACPAVTWTSDPAPRIGCSSHRSGASSLRGAERRSHAVPPPGRHPVPPRRPASPVAGVPLRRAAPLPGGPGALARGGAASRGSGCPCGGRCRFPVVRVPLRGAAPLPGGPGALAEGGAMFLPVRGALAWGGAASPGVWVPLRRAVPCFYGVGCPCGGASPRLLGARGTARPATMVARRARRPSPCGGESGSPAGGRLLAQFPAPLDGALVRKGTRPAPLVGRPPYARHPPAERVGALARKGDRPAALGCVPLSAAVPTCGVGKAPSYPVVPPAERVRPCCAEGTWIPGEPRRDQWGAASRATRRWPPASASSRPAVDASTLASNVRIAGLTSPSVAVSASSIAASGARWRARRSAASAPAASRWRRGRRPSGCRTSCRAGSS